MEQHLYVGAEAKLTCGLLALAVVRRRARTTLLSCQNVQLPYVVPVCACGQCPGCQQICQRFCMCVLGLSHHKYCQPSMCFTECNTDQKPCSESYIQMFMTEAVQYNAAAHGTTAVLFFGNSCNNVAGLLLFSTIKSAHKKSYQHF